MFSSVNHEIRDKRYRWKNPKVYESYTKVEIQGFFTGPEDRIGLHYELSIYGHDPDPGDSAKRLSDYQVRDDNGALRFHKVRGTELPVYDIPDGIGWHERRRGTQIWIGAVWVPPRTITDMLTLLPNVCPVFLSIHEHKVNRKRSIVSVSLQNSDPLNE